MSPRTAALALVVVGAWAWAAAPAFAEPKPTAKKAQAAVTAFEAAYRPIGALPAGVERTKQACSDADKLQAASDAIPDRVSPTALLDATTWSTRAMSLEGAVHRLGTVCKNPDHKIAIDLKATKFETADDVVASLDECVRELLDAARPRTLPSPMKKFRATMDKLSLSPKQLCTQQRALAKLLAEVASPPPGADATKWHLGHARTTGSLDELGQLSCSKQRAADEELAGSLSMIHDGYYDLVLLLPPHA